jgi:two-component system NtrC family response regulator
VGENESFTCDVRVLCATNRRLDEMVAQGEFREDLWFRINTFEIHLPALRERIADIPLLARHLASRFRHHLAPDDPLFTAEALAELQGYCWPGNVRELANAIEHALILCDAGPIGVEHLPARFTARKPPPSVLKVVPPSSGQSLRDLELQAIYDALNRHAGNKPKAAEELGVSVKTLYNKLNQAAMSAKSA